MQRLKLVLPGTQWRAQIADYKRKVVETDDTVGCGRLRKLEVDEWIAFCRDLRAGRNLPEAYVPATQYLAVRIKDNKLVGLIQIRHTLNAFLLEYCGHIGYSVAPEERGKGYATEMLGLALKKCKTLGIGKVMVSCAEHNTASARVIQKNGGVFENEVEYGGTVLQKYWFEV